jgi:hypothetical protein
VRNRSIASGIDTMTRAQLNDMKAAENWLLQLLRKYPELASENQYRGVMNLVGDEGGMAKVVNDLRHLAREAYESDPLPEVHGQPYCDRQKRPVDPRYLDLHLKECFVCSGAPEGRHGTRYVTEYSRLSDGGVQRTTFTDPPTVEQFPAGVIGAELS